MQSGGSTFPTTLGDLSVDQSPALSPQLSRGNRDELQASRVSQGRPGLRRRQSVRLNSHRGKDEMGGIESVSTMAGWLALGGKKYQSVIADYEWIVGINDGSDDMLTRIHHIDIHHVV